MMIRRFNYTNRIRLKRTDIRITTQQQNSELWFDAELSRIREYKLPLDGLVFVEAYRQTLWKRFTYGRVGALEPDTDRSLSLFESPAGILFRVKVTLAGDVHKLLAEADGIPLLQPDQHNEELEPLLSVVPRKLGDEIYRVDFSDRPQLLINSEAGNYSDIGRSSAFTALVYPAVLREILTRIITNEEYDESNSDDWPSQWIRFAAQLPGTGDIPSKDDDIQDREEWIDTAVAAFAKRIQVRSKFAEYWEHGQ